MTTEAIPPAYIGREQAYLKHTILRTYIQRLFMIVGQKKEGVINYVDCFSGPWQENDQKLSDTSIGISMEQMSKCQSAIKAMFGRDVKFRALYVEKDDIAFGKLQNFINNNPYNIEAHCLHGDYTSLLEEIMSWCDNHFTFFFVDPKGWQKVVGASTMRPLLQHGKAEFLINLMYDFINRAVEIEKHTDDMVELFGEAPSLSGLTPDQRQKKLLTLYRNNLKKVYGGRTAYVTVEKPGRDRTLYYLVYLTRHSTGLDTFKSEAEKMEVVQRITQAEVALRKQIEQQPMDDLFGSIVCEQPTIKNYTDNRLTAKAFLLDKLSGTPLLIDNEVWADFLEETDLYPKDFQQAMIELVKEGVVTNLDADVQRRTRKMIKPHWPNKSERWIKR